MRCGSMPIYQISVVNADFSVKNEEEHPDAAAAAGQGIKGALAVGLEAVLAVNSFFGAEVSVSDGESRQRFMVAVGVSPLND